jgi:hypothetical protein
VDGLVLHQHEEGGGHDAEQVADGGSPDAVRWVLD